MQTLWQCFAKKGMLKQTTVFDVSLHLHAIFKMSFEICCCICLQPCPKFTTRLFMNECCLLVSRTLPVWLSLSNVPWLVGVVFGPIFGHLEFIDWYSNDRNPGSKSGICCRVRTSFLHIDAVVLACTFPRPFVVVDNNHFAQQGSRAQI